MLPVFLRIASHNDETSISQVKLVLFFSIFFPFLMSEHKTSGDSDTDGSNDISFINLNTMRNPIV